MKTQFTKIIIIIALALTFNSVIFAASPGALDFSFSNDGRILSSISVSASGTDILIQSDGKILAAGIANLGATGNSFYVARFNIDTTLDTTFGTSGVSLIEFGTESSISSCRLKLQSDGKILVGGLISLATSVDRDIVLARLNPNGSLDTTFDSDGKVIISHSINFTEEFGNIDIASDGKILVFGGFENQECSIARLNTNGSLDTTFSSDGKHVFDLGSVSQSCSGVVQTDNKILVTTTIANVGAIGVGRFTTTGVLDTTFDTDGIASITFSAGLGRPSSIALQSNGRILVSGRAGFTEPDNSVIMRLNTNGTLDTTFDTDGRVELFIDTNLQESFGDLVIEPNGKITALLTTAGGGMARFNSNGSLDSTFGLNGIHRGTNLGRNALTIQADGKLLTVGTSSSSLVITRQTNNIQPSMSGDFDGDGFTDTALYRPTTGNWFVLNSSNSTVTISQFGANGDIPIDGDFDGDGRNDLAVYKPVVGQWWFQRSSDNSVFAAQFGTSTDKPTSGDYDKDGKTDIAFFRPSTGEWLVLRSSSNFSTFFGYPFGANGDIPIVKKGA